jgi:3'-phosphoadenosine 5'-phosphosulfate (PAPS) 3'-phosphatase
MLLENYKLNKGPYRDYLRELE